MNDVCEPITSQPINIKVYTTVLNNMQMALLHALKWLYGQEHPESLHQWDPWVFGTSLATAIQEARRKHRSLRVCWL